MLTFKWHFAFAAALLLGAAFMLMSSAQDKPAPAAADDPVVDESEPIEEEPAKYAPLPAPKGMAIKRLDPAQDAWIDTKRKWVIADGKIAIREGQLEMFACPQGTKEHESVVAVNAKAYVIHAALLAAGAKPGAPVKFFPDFVPAKGEIIDVYVLWVDKKGEKKSIRAQEWVKHFKSGDAMETDWVFAGSSFYKDEETGKDYYQAEAGDLICVSNFTTAMLDLPVESSQSAAGLLFAAFTDRIPPKGTPVRLVLVPRGMRKSPPMAPTLDSFR